MIKQQQQQQQQKVPGWGWGGNGRRKLGRDPRKLSGGNENVLDLTGDMGYMGDMFAKTP